MPLPSPYDPANRWRTCVDNAGLADEATAVVFLEGESIWIWRVLVLGLDTVTPGAEFL